MYDLILAGGGSGQPDYLLPVVKTELEKADFVIASERFLKIINVKNAIPLKNVYSQLEEIPELLEKGSVAIVVSGDPLLYSLLKTVQNNMPDINVRVLPGIGSLQLLGCAFGLTMENAKIMSIHGRECRAGEIAYAVSENETVFFFCSKEQGSREIAKALIDYNITDVQIYVGASLTYHDEELYSGTPYEILEKENRKLCVAAVKNRHTKRYSAPMFLTDDMFLRNESPMTKEEIRAIIISKLRLSPDSVVWDIGAGTGSISVECARICAFGNVYAVEYKEKALEIIEKNREYFGLNNLNVINGRAEQVISELPVPDSIFIGGSGGELPRLIDEILELPKNIKLVVSGVTLETQSIAYQKMKDLPDFRAVKIDVGYDKKIGSYRVMDCNHPIMLYSCKTKE